MTTEALDGNDTQKRSLLLRKPLGAIAVMSSWGFPFHLSMRSVVTAITKYKFGVIPVSAFYESKYIDGKLHRWGICRKEGKVFYIVAIYEICKKMSEFTIRHHDEGIS